MKAKILVLLMLVLLDPLALLAQADRHDVRQGNRRYGREDWKEAELSYRKALVKDSLSAAARYNLASALYRQENYEGAREMMGSFEGQENLSSDIYYNSGDVALQLKDYAAAVEAFKQSLLLNPGDLDAKENYIYAKKMLENQQNHRMIRMTRTIRTTARTATTARNPLRTSLTKAGYLQDRRSRC